jgi:PKD repeat protein
VPPTPTFTSGCSTTPYVPSSYLWDFGEPSSGAANSSTLTSPSHDYAATGTYTATLIIYSPCINDTLKKVITVSTPGPAVSVAGNTVICKGDKYTYNASGATTYSWSTGSSNTSVSLSPTITTAFSVTGTAGACKTTKVFTVTVNPCTGISEISDKEAFTIFPNPFKELITIDAKSTAELVINDLSGNLVLKTNLVEGKNEIATDQLKAGIYMVYAKDANHIWRGRFVKIE